MKKKILGLVLVIITLGGNVVAEATDKQETNGKVNFKEDTSVVSPLDPTNPDIPVVPEKPIKQNGGSLAIDYISEFNFGTQNISAKNEIYYAKLDRAKSASDSDFREVPNWVQVTDKRGTNTGWNLSIKQEEQFTTGSDGDKKELKGAQITLKNGVVKTTTDNESGAPSGFGSPLVLIPGSTHTIMNAAVNTGMGTWLESFGDLSTGAQSIELFVPGVTEKVKDVPYVTTLTWTLNDVPV